MATIDYRIRSGAANSGFDWTTINGAVNHYKTVHADAGVVPASTDLQFLIDGFLSLHSGTIISGIDTTTNSAARVVVGPYSNAWNAAPGRIGKTTSYDGIDNGSAQFFAGENSARQANLVIQNLVMTGHGAYNEGVITTNGPSPYVYATAVVLRNLILVNERTATASSGIVVLDGARMENCVGIFTQSATGGCMVLSNGRTTAADIDQCVFVSLASATAFLWENNTPNPNVRNTYVGGATSSTGSWPVGCVGNMVSHSSGVVDDTTYNIALSTTNFENVSVGTEDLRVKAASVLATTGATRLASVLTDIFGTSRDDPTTIGAHAAEVAGSAQAPRSNTIFNQMRA